MPTLLLTIALLAIGLPIHGQDSRQIATTHTSLAELLSALDQQAEFRGGGTGVQILDPDEFAPEVLGRRGEERKIGVGNLVVIPA